MRRKKNPWLGMLRGLLLPAIAAAALVYLILVLALRIITREDLELLPHGDRLARILRVH